MKKPAREDQPPASLRRDAPTVLLAGPPGSGKSALGGRVCTEYELGRMIADSPRAVARFASTWRAFGKFLRDSATADERGAEP